MREVPNLWQVTLGALRMWHRLLFRPESIGNCSDHPVRSTWRARLLANRALRTGVLLASRAIAPWDFSGLFSSRERVHRHLLRAHHEKNQFAYDLEMLSDAPEGLAELREVAQAVIDGSHPRAAWLRDLVIYEGYHEDLVAALDAALAGEGQLDPSERDDPDISFFAFLRWCARQPATPAETRAAWLDGRYTWADGLAPSRPAAEGERRAVLERLWAADRETLHARMHAGAGVDRRHLADSEWRGVSIGVPELIDRFAWKTFVKVFASEPGGGLRGWNLRLEQDGVDAPPRPKRDPKSGAGRWTFGHFAVLDAAGHDIPGGGSQGLLLDYGQGGNHPLDPVSRLRDPIVTVDAHDPDLLLGWSYLSIGGRGVRTPSFFTLERLGPRRHTARAPHPPRRGQANSKM